MEDIRKTVAARLREAGRAHHQAFIETDGDDPSWPDWYADYLINDLNALLRERLSLAQLRDLLIELDRSQRQSDPKGDWTRFYADRLVRQYGGAT